MARSQFWKSGKRTMLRCEGVASPRHFDSTTSGTRLYRGWPWQVSAWTPRGLISPTHRFIRKYYGSRRSLDAQNVFNEMNVRLPFETLLADVARLEGWTFVPELVGMACDSLVRPDGTVKDSNSLPRGYWEAKDTRDDLDAEIKHKTARGYKFSNIIFEDTRTGVLYQNRQEVLRVPLGDPNELAKLLNQFFSYKEPDIEGFDEAVEEFKEGFPEPYAPTRNIC